MHCETFYRLSCARECPSCVDAPFTLTQVRLYQTGDAFDDRGYIGRWRPDPDVPGHYRIMPCTLPNHQKPDEEDAREASIEIVRQIKRNGKAD